MSNGLYSAAAGMAAQQARMDALAGDVANLSTVAYKKQRVAFRELLYVERGLGTAGRSVAIGAGAAAVEAGRSFAGGQLYQVDDPLSLAIDGAGLFQVRRADGSLALTRAGNFRLDAERQLVLPSGERLVPPITIPANVNASDVSIGADGTVAAGGRNLGRFVLVDVPAPAGLASIGDNLYAVTPTSGQPRPVQRAAVRQGYLETSNVEVAEAMVSLLEAQRAFELASRSIRMHDQLMEIANGLRR
jgi:flagellar basal-body rod protein FlgG